MAMLEVKVDGLALDMTTNSPVVILTPHDSKKVLPIWIGHSEAWAIAMELSGVSPKRPMTHDLLKKVIGDLHGSMDRIEITEIKDQTFYAKIYLSLNGEKISIDARPSDSIALALKTGVPILAAEELFDLQSSPEKPPDISNDPESLADRLRKIDPEDFGKYSL